MKKLIMTSFIAVACATGLVAAPVNTSVSKTIASKEAWSLKTIKANVCPKWDATLGFKVVVCPVAVCDGKKSCPKSACGKSVCPKSACAKSCCASNKCSKSVCSEVLVFPSSVKNEQGTIVAYDKDGNKGVIGKVVQCSKCGSRVKLAKGVKLDVTRANNVMSASISAK